MVKINKAYGTKLQVPMDTDIYKGLKSRSKELGFDSVQAYIRFWANAEARQPDLKTDGHYLSRPAVQALRYIELLLAVYEDEYKNPQQALTCVVNQINRVRAIRDLHRQLGIKRPSV
jgi:hypothetical protein